MNVCFFFSVFFSAFFFLYKIDESCRMHNGIQRTFQKCLTKYWGPGKGDKMQIRKIYTNE